MSGRVTLIQLKGVSISSRERADCYVGEGIVVGVWCWGVIRP